MLVKRCWGASPRLKFTRVLFIHAFGVKSTFTWLLIGGTQVLYIYIGTYSTTFGNLKVFSYMFGWGVLIGLFRFTVEGRSKEGCG